MNDERCDRDRVTAIQRDALRPLLGGEEPQFWWDEDQQCVWFGCPHDPGVSVLQSNVWTVISKNPLTVTPSINNTLCGCHGFITDGKWCPA